MPGRGESKIKAIWLKAPAAVGHPSCGSAGIPPGPGPRGRSMRSLVAILLAPLLLASTVDARPLYAPESLERWFNLAWDVRPGPSGPTLEGYVYNKTDMLAERMQLGIEQLDAAGTVVGQTTTWVLGTLPAGDRSYFETRVPQAASYRVTILSFNWLSKLSGN